MDDSYLAKTDSGKLSESLIKFVHGLADQGHGNNLISCELSLKHFTKISVFSRGSYEIIHTSLKVGKSKLVKTG